MEAFSAKKAVELSGVTIFKAIKFGAIFISICVICYSVYVTIIKPHTSDRLDTTTEYIAQKIEYNYNNPDDAFFLGTKLWGFKLGLSKVKRIDIQEKEIIK